MNAPFEYFRACSHTAPDSCSRCNGDEQDASDDYESNVVQLVTPAPRGCSATGCAAPARWQVGPAHLSCDDHLGAAITAAFRAAQPAYMPAWGIA